MLEKEFVPYKIALALKELGFDEPCMAYYGKQETMLGLLYSNVYNGNLIENSIAKPHEIHLDVYAPLYQQAFRWFREKYNLYSFVFKFDEGFGYETYKEGITQTNDSFDTYEEAELACLEKLIEIVKSQKS